MLAGLVVMAVGTILLLNQFGVLPHGIILHFWPAVLIVVGIIKIFAGDNNADRVVGTFATILGAIEQAEDISFPDVDALEAPLLEISQ